MYQGKTIACVIPARLGSSRFPNKPLAKINGRELVLMVADIAKKSKYLDEIIIATEDKIIQDLATNHNYNSVITNSHYTCTHRAAEVAMAVDYDFIYNLQGDEPLTKPEWIDDMIKYAVEHDVDGLQGIRKLEPSDIEDEDVCKIIINNGVVTHMQRNCDVICDNVAVQLGLFLYKREVLIDFPNCDMTFVKYWKGLDVIGFCGKYNIMPLDLKCGKIRAVDRPHHIQEIEQLLC